MFILRAGESNVYTIGNVGPHRVVSTKLPQIGRQMAAQISSGNTTTRLLGISHYWPRSRVCVMAGCLSVPVAVLVRRSVVRWQHRSPASPPPIVLVSHVTNIFLCLLSVLIT